MKINIIPSILYLMYYKDDSIIAAKIRNGISINKRTLKQFTRWYFKLISFFPIIFLLLTTHSFIPIAVEIKSAGSSNMPCGSSFVKIR